MDELPGRLMQELMHAAVAAGLQLPAAGGLWGWGMRRGVPSGHGAEALAIAERLEISMT